MPFFHLGPRIEVHRNRSRPLHIEDNTTHVRRSRGYRNISVLVRSRSRRRTPSPEPQIIEVEPSESYQRRYRSPAPSPEPRPREYYYSQFHHNVPVPHLPLAPATAPAPGPINSIADLTARNAALEAEMRELRDQFRASRIREEMLPRRCDGCGCTALACRCAGLRPGRDTSAVRATDEYSSMSPAAAGGSSLRFDAARDIHFEIREPRAEHRQRVRWVDELDWD